MRKLPLFLIAAVASAAFGAKLDGVAARVDSGIITVGDVMAELRRLPAAREADAAGDDAGMAAFYNEAVNVLVERRLILKAAAAKKMEIPEWVIDNQIREIVHEMFGGDMNRLEEELARSKTPFTEYRSTIKEDITVRGMKQQMVDQYVSVSPAQMREEFASHPERYRTEAKATVRVILLKPAAQGEGIASVKTRGSQILEEIAAGKNFADLAVMHSVDSHAKDGGLWKDVNPEESFRPEIASEIAKLKDGMTSELIDLDGWGFIVKKESSTEAKTMTFAEAYEKILGNVRKENAKKAYADWIARLKEDAFVKVYPPPKD